MYTAIFSETIIRGTVCGKSARTDLWGSGKATNPLYPEKLEGSNETAEIELISDELLEIKNVLGTSANIDLIASKAVRNNGPLDSTAGYVAYFNLVVHPGLDQRKNN
ncbi:MAG: hypothetical protein U5K69_09025 [Balneolaceae bacterium]|nr:hypothetical protein [Balneolaceae bacterium]